VIAVHYQKIKKRYQCHVPDCQKDDDVNYQRLVAALKVEVRILRVENLSPPIIEEGCAVSRHTGDRQDWRVWSRRGTKDKD
jgi:hypothetical protein